MIAAETTPTGTQETATLVRRRALVVGVNLATYAALLAVLAAILADQGWSWVDVFLFAAFAIGAPWTVLGFWNAVIGFWLLHGARDGLAAVAPFAAAGDTARPVGISTAVLMTIRNEDPARAIARLRVVKASLDATREGARFDYFLLSDTGDGAIAAAEAKAFVDWQAGDPDGARLHYRRRETNSGYKAGNLRDFCARWGGDYALMLPLDADSLMTGETIVRMVRIMEAYPRLGILQSLVVGMPSESAFARIFQFGMRHGMRAYTMGSAWWAGDCGPFWGHNALVRIAPFATECDLPLLPGGPPLGGHVLSHDQVEATLMRRAGFEVRVLPVEAGSWEENPPTILEFTRRDTRWCQGNLQYLKLLDLPGLRPMSRFQLLWAILMFIGVPAWTLLIALVALKTFDGEGVETFPTGLAIGLYGVFFVMCLAPKLAGFLDVLVTQGGTARYGGTPRFLASAAIEIAFSFLLGAVSTLRTTLFMAGLVFGRSSVWAGQARDAHALSWATAWRGLRPHLVFGLVVVIVLAAMRPLVLWWALPLVIGFVVAIPFAVATAHPAIGAFFVRHGLNGIPEDFTPPAEVKSLAAPVPA
ncbi:MAG: glucans biosynthesis glucosyltransferase MdoH [Alphaproteobacteria bacterium]|nr:glucans biosynthesis glucosyltransferase MdoH [Alphaproteobacteria bacterium]